MIFINIKPKPKRSFAVTFGQEVVQKFLGSFAKIEDGSICIDDKDMMTFPEHRLN